MRKTVAIGFVGTTLDYVGKGAQRWERWRPSVGLCQQDDIVIHRLELLHDARSRGLFERLRTDIAAVSPETEVRSVEITLRDPWDFEEVYSTLHDFTRGYAFDTEAEDYLIHITTGTHVAQICWFLLAEARYLPAKLIQTAPPRKKALGNTAGSYSVIDLDLSRYDKIATRFAREREDTVSLLKSGIATRNPAFNRMIEQIERVASRSKAPMLLFGPTGAGKSFLARRVYEMKKARHQLGGRFGELGLDEQAMLLKAIEEKRFLPFGSDREVESDFQLIAGTVRDLRQWVAEGRFREDLYARINLWTFDLPGLADRPEDLEPNLDFELARFAREHGEQVRFHTEARRIYLKFVTSPQARWTGNFRELSASVTRLATLAEGGRITEADVADEIARLQRTWAEPDSAGSDGALADLLGDEAASLDLFDRMQLENVVAVCRESASLSDAGRRLFDVSRTEKAKVNDADRLRKYLARFGLNWARVRAS
jgi:transcriptional regulatory protein RtcR